MKKYLFILSIFSLFLTSCDEQEPEVYNGPDLAYFTAGTVANYYVQDVEGSSYDIEVGVTVASDTDRTINVSIDPASTADASQFTIGNTMVIPAGEYVGTVQVFGSYEDVVSGSTLILNLEDVTGSEVATFDNTFSMTFYQFCPFVRDEFLGVYEANEEGFGVYESVATAGEADNELLLSNVWGVSPTTTTRVFLNDNNPSNFVLDFPPYLENYLFDHPTYGPAYIYNGYGTFDACEKVIDMYFQVRVEAGVFPETHITFTKL